MMRRSTRGCGATCRRRPSEAVYERVQDQLPTVVGTITDEIGVHIDQLLDPKIMVIDHFHKNPALVNRIFRDFGQRELNLMVNFGFIFGFLLGIPVAFIDHIVHQWWLLPVLGVVVGWTTNLLGMSLIFEPAEPKRILGIKVHGLFLRRQDEAAEVYAQIIADDVITLEKIGDFLLDGPRGDRTRQMLEDALGPAIDRAAGPARGAVRVAIGAARYDSDPRRGGPGGRRPHADAVPGPGVQRAAGEKIRKLVASAHEGAAAARLRRDDALGDQGGRVDALRPRRDHGRWPAASCTWRSSGQGG